MAGSVNKVILVGRLGADPELRYTPNGTPVANFRMATSDYRKDPNGERIENTEWHRIVVFGKLAEFCGRYLSKGRQIYVEGRLQTRSWEDKDGKTRWTTEIIARNIQILDSIRSEANKPQAPDSGEEVVPPEEIPIDDDIPF